MEPKRIPLNQRLKRRQHIEIARLQDIIVEALYKVFPESVLHGGTAIWRCYSGSRFSEDIDMYMEKDEEKIEELFSQLKSLGFAIAKKRVKENSLYSRLVFNGTEVRFEAVFSKVRGVVKEYETYEGILMNVYTLLPEDIIIEKVSAYLKRRKIRDLYDTFFLLRYVNDAGRIKPALRKLLLDFSGPLDESDLKALILFGVSPETNGMLEYIKRWLK
ncbi:MAG TPA: nucleotidyl transferase AbiEii/AbiGii toxin family protein [archaeon]|nr:nucleotidyl transferase AbiEii/AbiGii toxin family protein [archaeon]